MYFIFSKSGITKMLATILLAVFVIGSAIVAYEFSQSSPPKSSPTPTPATTPTASPILNPTQTPTAPTQKPSSTATPNPAFSPTPTPTSPTEPVFINVTGYALYELSPTEFVFSSGTKTYNVTMDLTTQAINLNGKLLGGYQIVSQIIPVTSLPLTITGTVSGSTIMAQIVLIPTTKDKIT